MQSMIPQNADIKLVGIHVAHSDASGSRSLTLPARSLILDAFAVCTESAAGSPSVSFGTAVDRDGLFSGLGGVNVADTAGDVLEDVDSYGGRGDFVVRTDNEADLRTKATKYNASDTVYLNYQGSAGTAGEWDLYIMYVILPVIG
ncbi:MAG: hypothetical protein WC477_06350 [Patescibacteria group bacterium]